MHANDSDDGRAFARAAARLASRAIMMMEALDGRASPSAKASDALGRASRAAQALEDAARSGGADGATLAQATSTLEAAADAIEETLRPRPAYHLVRGKARA